jgi:Flp pilus assembly protein TadB
LFLGGVAVLALVGLKRRSDRRRDPSDEAAFLRSVSAEVRSGASLRHGLLSAVAAEPKLPLAEVGRLAAAGAPFRRIAPVLEEAMPYNGRLVAAVLRMSDRIGGGASALFSHLASITDEDAAIAAERRVATAQARLSAAVVVGAPLIFTILLLVSGGRDLFSGPGLAIAALGLALQLIGLGVVAAMLWRSR